MMKRGHTTGTAQGKRPHTEKSLQQYEELAQKVWADIEATDTPTTTPDPQAVNECRDIAGQGYQYMARKVLRGEWHCAGMVQKDAYKQQVAEIDAAINAGDLARVKALFHLLWHYAAHFAEHGESACA